MFLIPNLDKRPRSSYFMWMEGQVPIFIMEITSKSTWRDDIGRKRDLYESWGVSEVLDVRSHRGDAPDAIAARLPPG